MLLCVLLGYAKYYKSLREFLLAQPSVAQKIELIPKEDKGVTGNFEVTVVATGQLLHSKRQAGQGRAESMQERRMLLEQIQELLQELEEEE